LTTSAVTKRSLSHYEPGRNDPCLCGSGLKFKKCCAGAYSYEASDLFKISFNKGDYEDALNHARHHFTWYALCYRAHTVPLLQVGTEAGDKLLAIDIEALASILDNLHLCHFRLGRGGEFLRVIQSIKRVIEDERWNSKVIYILSLWHLIYKEDAHAAFSVLSQIDMDRCLDPDVLALYLQVCSAQLSLTDATNIIDRILANSQSASYRLQYSILKGLKYSLACQHTDGHRIIREALEEFRSLSDTKESSYGRLKFAYGLELYGKLVGRQESIQEAEQVVKELLAEVDDDGYSSLYRADLYRLLADCEEAQGMHVDAIKAYYASLEANDSDLTKLFLARAICNSSDIDSARELLNSVNSDDLDEAGKFDFAISWALLASSSLLSRDLAEAKSRLKAAEVHDPLFVQERDRWLIELLESVPKSSSGRIRKLIQSLNSYVTLNPNFFGIGVNLNRLIEDLENPVHKDIR